MSGKTIEDVAKELGYSVGTISRAINRRKGVSEKTRQKILQAMDEMGYQPNAVAQSLTTKQTHSIAVIIPDVSHNLMSDIALAIETELAQKKYDMLLFNTKWDPEVEREKIMLAQAKRVDGIILKPAVDTTDFMKAIHTPTVLVNQTYPNGDVSYVDIDNERGGFMGTEYLIQCGYRRIAFLMGDINSGTLTERLHGYRRALEQYDLPFDENLICHKYYTVTDGYEQLKKLMQLPNPPDAVFANRDVSALGAYQYTLENSISVPRSFGIVGFDNDEISDFPLIKLTTIDQPRHQIGQLAARMVIDMIEGGENWRTQKILLSPQLIARNTTRKRRK